VWCCWAQAAQVLRELGARQLVVNDRELDKAAELAATLNILYGAGRALAVSDLAAALRGASGLIHATPTGMDKLPGLPLPESLLRPDLWVSEIVYFPIETALLKAARQLGCRTVDGGHMAVGQAVGAFRLFTGRESDPARMDAHFRRLLAERGN
jgi:shikimate dehydrogenase